VALFPASGMAEPAIWQIRTVALYQSGFLDGESGLLSCYVSTFALLYLAAAAQLTFTTENRSMPWRCSYWLAREFLRFLIPMTWALKVIIWGYLTDPFWTCIATYDSRSSASPDELLMIFFPPLRQFFF
jgi:hypothetical protein